jgi:hypothetical protein
MRGAIRPLPNAVSWCGAQLNKSTWTALPLPFKLPVYVLLRCRYFPVYSGVMFVIYVLPSK